MINTIENLAYEICRIPSITGDEALVMDYMSQWLSQQGLLVEKIPVDERRFNILASVQKKPYYATMLCTHLDTVAPFIPPTLDKEMLWGRGACDAKGIAASMAFALLRQREAGFDDGALLFTVGEEDASDGARACAGTLQNRAHYVVVGEPTDLRAAYAQKGCLVFDLEAQGKEAHSSMPHLGESALHNLVDDINKLVRYPWPKHERLKETLLNIGEFHGGSMRNVVAGSAYAKGIMRTSVSNDTIVSIIKGSLGPRVLLHVRSSTDPFDYVVPQGFETFLAGFGSDAPYLRGVGKPMLIGPGSLECAHKPDERISFHDLYRGCEAYQKIASQIRTEP